MGSFNLQFGLLLPATRQELAINQRPGQNGNEIVENNLCDLANEFVCFPDAAKNKRQYKQGYYRGSVQPPAKPEPGGCHYNGNVTEPTTDGVKKEQQVLVN